MCSKVTRWVSVKEAREIRNGVDSVADYKTMFIRCKCQCIRLYESISLNKPPNVLVLTAEIISNKMTCELLAMDSKLGFEARTSCCTMCRDV